MSDKADKVRIELRESVRVEHDQRVLVKGIVYGLAECAAALIDISVEARLIRLALERRGGK